MAQNTKPNMHDATSQLRKQKRKEHITPFSVTLMRSQVLYPAAQGTVKAYMLLNLPGYPIQVTISPAAGDCPDGMKK